MLEVLVVLGVLAVLAVVVFGALRNKTTATWDSKGRQKLCFSNVDTILIAIQMYQQDHNGQYPSKETIWSDIALPSNLLTCPTYGTSKGIGYGYNQWVSEKTLSSPGMSRPQSLIMLADSAKPDHLLSANTDIDPRHTGQATLGYADGHAVLTTPSTGGTVAIKP
ncbi:MAG: hypothetical protein ACYDCO_23805 [Armatimonadota bacterium]